jgi:hypothetical protein
MLVELQDAEAAALLESLGGAEGVEPLELSRGRFEAKVGRLHIRVENAKVPHGPWDPKLHEIVHEARRWYWETWGQIPLDDELDDHSYVDVAWISYPDGSGRNGSSESHQVVEGVSVRTVYIDCPGTSAHEQLPDDLRFWVGPGEVPLLDLMADRLYDGNRLKARRKLVVGSRLASVRAPGRRHNLYTPEAYAASQLVSAWRAIQDGAEFFINTMREEMTANVLSLPDGWHYQHFRTEHRLGLDLGAIHLNRADPFVFGHMCSYPGYFTNTADFVATVEGLLARGIPGFDADALRCIGVDVDRLPTMKATHLKVFSELLAGEGRLGSLSSEQFRDWVRREVGDGPRSFTTPVRERLAQAVKILTHSPISRRNGVAH